MNAKFPGNVLWQSQECSYNSTLRGNSGLPTGLFLYRTAGSLANPHMKREFMKHLRILCRNTKMPFWAKILLVGIILFCFSRK